MMSFGCSFTVFYFPFQYFHFYVTPKGNLLNNLNFKVESNKVRFLFVYKVESRLSLKS